MAIPPIPINSVGSIVTVIGVVRPQLHKLQWTDFSTEYRYRYLYGGARPLEAKCDRKMVM